ncbi:hypothetical protein [Mesorhizobium sp.]|uniref:hypothetical protein n=1 Tax=Mesorhizobium sp. TaxID=1871066 RepID=UPI000FE83E3B|nr:hypothetical protein [Mesorhizobium sp.]RWF63265.1 MAG: hypothetical protein EOS47_19955 [Mesorhizobium sp.]
MGRVKFALIPLAILASVANAQPLQNIENCRQLTDGVDRLACYDALQPILAPSEDHGESPVKVASSRFDIQQRDMRRSIYNPRIELHLSFANYSTKRVKAVALAIIINDAFGDTILTTEGKLDLNIRPGGSDVSPSFFFWDDNEFMNDDEFSKLIGPVSAGTAKTDVTVRRVVYQDGSIENY